MTEKDRRKCARVPKSHDAIPNILPSAAVTDLLVARDPGQDGLVKLDIVEALRSGDGERRLVGDGETILRERYDCDGLARPDIPDKLHKP